MDTIKKDIILIFLEKLKTLVRNNNKVTEIKATI